MRARGLVVVAGASLTATALVAQPRVSPQCASQAVAVRDACQLGTDVFQLLAPQLNGAMAAGGPVIGTARTTDGVSVSLRLSALDGRIPDLSGQAYSPGGLTSRAIPGTRTQVLAPSLDLSLSVLPGVVFGGVRVLTADALVSVMYTPDRDVGAFRVRTTNSAFRTGFGARVGLLAESARLPAVSVSFLRRSSPNTSYATSLQVPIASSTLVRDSLTLAEMSLRTDAFRAAVSKRVWRFEIGGGGGVDRSRNFAQVRTRVTPVALSAPLTAVTSAFVATQTLSRHSAYGSLALNLDRWRVGLEAGAIFGGDSVQTANELLVGNPNAAQRYATLALRYLF